jgi:collagenase-like PrtC family protease
MPWDKINYSFVIYRPEDFSELILSQVNFKQIIIPCLELSSIGKMDFRQALKICSQAIAKNIQVSFLVDPIINEYQLKEIKSLIDKIPQHPLVNIRAKDKGIIFYLSGQKRNCEVILEDGQHNLLAVKTMSTLLGESLKKIIISYQLSREQLKELASTVKIPLEILALGPIPIFHTPRKLLEDVGQKEVIANSLESAHKGFYVLEHYFGSTMYHLKDLSLLERLDKLQEIGIDQVRIDFFRYQKDFSDLLQEFQKLQSTGEIEKFKKYLGTQFTRGYFDQNKTDILFNKIRKKTSFKHDKLLVGKVMANNKKSGSVVQIQHPDGIRKGQKFVFLDSSNNTVELFLDRLVDIDGRDCPTLKTGELLRYAYVKKMSINTNLYSA